MIAWVGWQPQARQAKWCRLSGAVPMFAPADYVLLVLLVGSMLIGLWRGFFREAMSLVVWIAALWMAASFAAAVAPQLAGLVHNPQLRLWVARALVLIAVLVVGGILSALLAAALRSAGLGGTDRVLGMLFGCARGVLLVAAGIVVVELAGLRDEPWWRESKLVPYAAPVADALRELAEQGLGRPWSLSVSRSPDVPAGRIKQRS